MSDTATVFFDHDSVLEAANTAIAAVWDELNPELQVQLQKLDRETKGLAQLLEHYRSDRNPDNRAKLVHQLHNVERLRDEYYVLIGWEIDVANQEASQAFYTSDPIKAHSAAQRRDKLRGLLGKLKAFFARLWRKVSGTQPGTPPLHDRQFAPWDSKKPQPDPRSAIPADANPYDTSVPVA